MTLCSCIGYEVGAILDHSKELFQQLQTEETYEKPENC